MNNRLLSEEEMEDAIESWGSFPLSMKEVATAQLAKTDKEWAAWGESKCDNDTHGDTRYGVIKRMCVGCWQERKKELNL